MSVPLEQHNLLAESSNAMYLSLKARQSTSKHVIFSLLVGTAVSRSKVESSDALLVAVALQQLCLKGYWAEIGITRTEGFRNIYHGSLLV